MGLFSQTWNLPYLPYLPYQYTFPVFRKKSARAQSLLSTVFQMGGKQTRFCLRFLREEWFLAFFSTSIAWNFCKLQYVFTIYDTIIPSKFLSKQTGASKDIRQNITFP